MKFAFRRRNKSSVEQIAARREEYTKLKDRIDQWSKERGLTPELIDRIERVQGNYEEVMAKISGREVMPLRDLRGAMFEDVIFSAIRDYDLARDILKDRLQKIDSIGAEAFKGNTYWIRTELQEKINGFEMLERREKGKGIGLALASVIFTGAAISLSVAVGAALHFVNLVSDGKFKVENMLLTASVFAFIFVPVAFISLRKVFKEKQELVTEVLQSKKQEYERRIAEAEKKTMEKIEEVVRKSEERLPQLSTSVDFLASTVRGQ